ncbi:aminopeptidase P family N-terminal domain-containing protein, partial [Alterinioella nitratireducens]
MSNTRPEFYRFHNGDKPALQFAQGEYDARLMGLRAIMDANGVDAVVLSSMHNIAYYSGFLYCAFGRAYALVVTAREAVTISAGIDAGQPWRRGATDNITYTDWQRDNYWRAIVHVAGKGKSVGIEGDHLTLAQSEKMRAFMQPSSVTDIAPMTMQQRMRKSPAELEIIRAGANTADVGGYAIRDAVKIG